MKLCIYDIEGSAVRSEYAIWGRMFVQIGNICFPASEWCDAVSSVLDMWTAELCGYIRQKRSECQLYFMDGPYFLNLYKTADRGLVLISCQNREGTEFANTTIQLSEFLEEILNTVRNFLDLCRKKSLSFTDTKIFSEIVASCMEIEAFLKGNGRQEDGFVV